MKGGDAVRKDSIKKVVATTIVKMAKKASGLEANTACACLSYQSKEPQEVKKLRKF